MFSRILSVSIIFGVLLAFDAVLSGNSVLCWPLIALCLWLTLVLGIE